MSKVRLFVVIVCAACGASKGDAPTVTKETKGDADRCPLPVNPAVRERFAVGVVPDHRVASLYGEAPHCHLQFVDAAGVYEAAKAAGGAAALLGPGTFEGHCPGETDKMTLEAVVPAKLVVEVNGLPPGPGELGVGKPLQLDGKVLDKAASVVAHVADRCGTPLSLGATSRITQWSAAGCDKVARLVPWALSGPADPKAEEMQVFPVGVGTCTIKATTLGVTGEVAVTVR
jgi:hypothetical protein